MKRPQGFERATPKAPPPTPPAGGQKPAAQAGTPSAAKRSPAKPASRPSGASPGEATTEPITLPSRSGIAPVSPLRGDAPPPASASSKAARLGLRLARRARKRYERDEVRRFTWRSRRRRTAWLVSLGVIVALLATVTIGAYSPLMALRTIEVVGTDRVPAGQVSSALKDQLGTPLPLIDFARVKSELGKFTLIQSFVTESRPPGTLVVRIVEREPIGVIPSKAGFDLVDAAGVVIESDKERPEGYPAIDAPKGVGSAGFAAAAEVVAALPEGIRTQLDTVTAATKDDVTLELAGGARVVWGSAERSEFKAVVLGALMVGHPAGTVNEYDVSSPDSAVLR